jgi:hypothetical protein
MGDNSIQLASNAIGPRQVVSETTAPARAGRMSNYKAKRFRKAISLFEWHVTHTKDDVLWLCDRCLERSLKELRNLTGRRLTRAAVYTVAAACEKVAGNTSMATTFAVQWAIGQFEAAVALL